MRSFRNKTALVTGAASGIGRATSIALARKGARLIVCDIDEDGLEETSAEIDAISRCLLAKRVDVASRDEMAAFANEVRDRVEAVDGLDHRFANGVLICPPIEVVVNEPDLDSIIVDLAPV